MECLRSRRRRQKMSITSVSATSTASSAVAFFVTRFFLRCFAPLQCRSSTIFSSAPIARMMEEYEMLKLERMMKENGRLKLGQSSIDDLPHHLLTDIFQRLPINAVFTAKCVSKKWLSLISDPLFVQSYIFHQQSLSPPFTLFYTGFIPESKHPCRVGHFCPPSDNPQSLTFPLKYFTAQMQKRQKQRCALQLIGCSNDLLLFSESGESFSTGTYFVCNPLTSQWITLPEPPRRWARYPVAGFMVEDDGTFWVVHIMPCYLSSLVFQVYCSKTGKWSFKNLACPRQFESFLAKTTVVYRGNILWIVDSGLVAFDPRNKTLTGFYDLPDNLMGRLGVSCGRLYYYEVSGHDLKVWMMVNLEAGEWVLQHGLTYDHMWSSEESLGEFLLLPDTEKYLQWVSFHPIDSNVVFLKCDHQLVTCKLSSGCLEVVQCNAKQGIFYRLEWDVIPLVFKPWPTAVAITFKEIDCASTS